MNVQAISKMLQVTLPFPSVISFIACKASENYTKKMIRPQSTASPHVRQPASPPKMFAQLRQPYAEFTTPSPSPCMYSTGTLEPSVTIRYSTEVQSAKQLTPAVAPSELRTPTRSPTRRPTRPLEGVAGEGS
jgi:hypothetical protein